MIKRGEIWTVRWTGLAGKSRPALVVQADEYMNTQTEIMALVTSDDSEIDELRVPIVANEKTGLDHDSVICLDKLMAVPLENIGQRIGEVSHDFMIQIDKKLMKVLGLNELFISNANEGLSNE